VKRNAVKRYSEYNKVTWHRGIGCLVQEQRIIEKKIMNYEANRKKRRKFFAYMEILLPQHSSQLANLRSYMLLLL